MDESQIHEESILKNLNIVRFLLKCSKKIIENLEKKSVVIERINLTVKGDMTARISQSSQI